jgi:hypothetical protein
LSTKATDPTLGSKQYPTVQQFSVADAIYFLVSTTSRTLETGTASDPTIEVVATITQHQAEAAINWLYGKTWSSLSTADKLKRPGDN